MSELLPSDPPAITQHIADYVCATGYDDLPADALEIAKRCVVDGAAVILAGATEPCARIIRTHMARIGGGAEATTLGAGSFRGPMQLAALANGVAGHALDWDDTALSRENDRSVLIHPTMQPLSAGLAVGEHLSAAGRDFLTAFVLGFEIQVKIAEAIDPAHFTGGRGFHSTGTIGVFGACIAAAKLLGLSVTETRNAIAIAATLSSGLGINHGTMSKSLNMGRASETGVTAAGLARLGFDGPANALEGGRGFFEAFGGGFDPARISGRLGNPFAILDPGTSIKPYPCGVVGHPGMDAMKALVTTHGIRPEDVARVTVRTGSNVLHPGPLRIAHAETALQAKFCVPFQMAAIILRRKAGLAEFSDAFVRSSACQEMQRRIDAVRDPAIEALGKHRIVFEIALTTRDGRVVTQRSADAYRGGPDNPLSWQDLGDKFHDCAASTLTEDERCRFLDLAKQLDRERDVSRMIGLLAPGARP